MTDPREPGDESASAQRRGVRSYVLRTGRITEAQTRSIAELLPRYGIAFSPGPLDLAAAFGRDAPKVLEIGFGMGETTARIAQANPAIDYLAIEVHTPGVGGLLKRIRDLGLENVRIVQHDAVEVLEKMIQPASLDGVHVFFPDPWPKKRHHKRRLVQPSIVALIASRMKPGAILHVATDWEDYAAQILDVLSAEPSLANTADGFAPRPESRPLTKFENRGLKLGHPVWDILFRRR
ncbi:MAG: tRNA (guanosine(46)-N7)-methyltransferase TrmB [Burkholderiales bacterium]|jgi:tRNA (guanine-N7-)-methyltransferase|nr:tRNA (guanosine(46)-N7)-methyltransferase TrmB [Burkholderiales bacterium]